MVSDETSQTNGTLLNASELKFYRHQGYFISPSPVLSGNELIAFQQLCHSLVDEAYDPAQRAFIDHLHVKHGDFLQYALRDDLLNLAEDVLGPDFGLAWSAALIKNKKSDFALGWHSDFYETQFEEELLSHPYLSINLAATPSTRESGCFQLIPRSHLRQTNRKSAAPTAEELLRPEYNVFKEEDGPCLYQEVFAEMMPGQFLLHDPHTVHRSAPNRSGYHRILINFWYISTDASRLSRGAIEYLKTKSAGRIHLRGKDLHKICAISVKSI